MISIFLILISAAFADTCEFKDIPFDLVTLENRNRAVLLKKTGEKVAFPEGGLAVNLIQVSGQGSLCVNSAVYLLRGGRAAILFERLDSSITNTYAAVFNFEKKAFEFEPVVLAPGLELNIKPTPTGFSFADFRPMGAASEMLQTGVGAAAGLDMVAQQQDLWKTVELGPKGLVVKLDKDLTWQNSRWKKYFSKRTDFENALKVGKEQPKTTLYFAFSREKKKDCIMIDHGGDKKAYCAPITAAKLSAPADDDGPDAD